MAGKTQSTKDSAMAAHLVKMGIWHGRRMTKGLSNIPVMEAGSAAYRRLVKKNQKNNRK